MKVTERRLGRVFHLALEPGDDFYGEFNRFVKEKNIRSGSVFVFGAMDAMDVIAGFKSMNGYDVDRRHFDDRRELVGLGNISWPDTRPAALGDGIQWTEPQPYVHIHMAVSGAPGKTEEVLTGHLSGGVVKGMFVDVYELI
ncbi:MAG: DNA-binding protein [Betaproteobacteria bacterium]|nr:DNA-binding protein [Betaproteobacteria bacterium]MBI2292072.1 DNA-binding protein [Betaproteobacteria bacterium]